eukprot:SAG31_NODE_506_length_14749_cov_8.119181_5_plen_84_part_00
MHGMRSKRRAWLREPLPIVLSPEVEIQYRTDAEEVAQRLEQFAAAVRAAATCSNNAAPQKSNDQIEVIGLAGGASLTVDGLKI